MSEILIKDFDKIVNLPFSYGKPEYNKWEALPYETANFNGNMLFAVKDVNPQVAEINPNVKGYYKIYLCLASPLGSPSSLEFSISTEGGWTLLNSGELRFNNGYNDLTGHTWVEELFFGIKDLTNAKFLVRKPKNSYTALCFIRLEPVFEREYKDFLSKTNNMTVMYHFDNDFFTECDYKNPEDYLGRLNMLDNGNAESLVHEVCFDYCDNKDKGYISYSSYFNENAKRIEKGFENGKKINKLFAKNLHNQNKYIYGGFRTQVSDFNLDTLNFYQSNDAQLYPQFRCYTRDNRPMQILSYAYPEVRKLVIERLLNTIPDDFDGISLFFHRGINVAFEKPVKERVMELYGVDASKLPYSDERLNSVLNEYITVFLRELKSAFNERAKKENRSPYKINVIVYYDVESSKNFGYDVEKWAKEGLIDSISQGLMKYYEDLSDVLDKDGLIDIEQYKKVIAEKHVLKRIFDSDVKNIVGGVKGFLDISQKYGIKFFATLPWECMNYEHDLMVIDELYKVGVENFICWNANHFAKNLPILNAVKFGTNKDSLSIMPCLRKIHKLLSINNCDISQFEQNWKG